MIVSSSMSFSHTRSNGNRHISHLLGQLLGFPLMAMTWRPELEIRTYGLRLAVIVLS